LSLERLIDGLARARANFVVVGMVAGQMYGSRIATYDLDIVYEVDDVNIERIVAYLLDIDAYVKDTWPNEGMASEFSRDLLLRDKSLTLGTSEGEIDLLDRIDGLGGYGNVYEHSVPIKTSGGLEVRVLMLEGLIAAKRASNREKDRLHLIELEALAEMHRHRSQRPIDDL
jgi:hypothetical protein